MITVVSSTNREGATTRRLADYYLDLLQTKGQQVIDLNLANLPQDFVFTALYGQQEDHHPEWIEIQGLVDRSEKFVFIIPEYNGSYPGILKAFIDGLKFPHSFKGKAAALIGISSGTQGGALAMSHLTDILNYFGMFVLPVKPRLAQIHRNFDGIAFSNPIYQNLIEEQVNSLINFNCMDLKRI